MPDSSKMIEILISVIGGLIAASGGFICGWLPVAPTIVIGILIAISGGTIAFLGSNMDKANIKRAIIGLNGGVVAGIGGSMCGIFADPLQWSGIAIGVLIAVAGGLIALISYYLALKTKGQ